MIFPMEQELTGPLAKLSVADTEARIKQLQEWLDSPLNFWKRIAMLAIDSHPEWGLKAMNGQVEMSDIPF